MQVHTEFDRTSPADEGIDQYVRRRQIHLARTLEGRFSIFLDLKFWIALRKAASGESTDPQAFELLDRLRALVSTGRVYCPISESVFSEILKQSDQSTLKQTAALVDELSLGVSLIPSDVRAMTELAHWICSKSGRDTHPLNHLVWTKLSCTLGSIHPTFPGLEPATERQLQKSFFEHMWTIPLSEMVDRMSQSTPAGIHDFDAQASALNHGKDQHAAELRSFKQTYTTELRGVLDIYAEQGAEIIADMALKEIGSRPAMYSPEWSKCANNVKGMLAAAFDQREQTKTELPSIHISTSLHACFRWNKTQRFKPNDFLDFQHASAALGYCDAFFTEASLRSVVTRSDIALDKRYECTVVSTMPEAIAVLKSL